MLQSWTLLRGLAWLKRLALAAESLAESNATLARISQDEWEQTHAPRPRARSFVSGTLDQAAANQLYKDLHRGEFDTE